ncbi:Dual specificity/tyrosine protein phosphatase, N-terminal [Phytophthora cactorum]|nr:Dual specificity/tyrosine protein phosphatase, N-terminal [Phytophthora cactorum]
MDGDLVYARFFADFGPLHLSRTVRFCRELESRLGFLNASSIPINGNRVVLYCSDHPHKRANAMTLLAIFLVVAGGLTPELAVTRVLNDGKLLPPFGFRDASCGVCTFFITLLDCARAVHKAITSSIWSYQTFSVEEYDHLDSLENGDINWIVPGKLIAFSGLQRERIVLDAESGATTLLAKDYAALFRDINVTCVIRFNEFTTYDRKAFIHAGLRHIDMPFRTAATQATKSSTSSSAYECLNLQPLFLHRSSLLCAIFLAVGMRARDWSCGRALQAGLGRTGTSIAAFLMKNYRFSATEAIAWCRICRPGSIVGPQQHSLPSNSPNSILLRDTPTCRKFTVYQRRKKYHAPQAKAPATNKTHINSR